jgi:hypothetical protein
MIFVGAGGARAHKNHYGTTNASCNIFVEVLYFARHFHKNIGF